MIFSRTSQYAIQTLIYIATQPPGRPILARDVAERLGVPAAYLAKIMQTLSKGNLLASYRGPQGGFRLRQGADKTDLMQIVNLTEGAGFVESCVLGLKICSDSTPCPMHAKWKPIKQEVLNLLQEQTLEMLAAAVTSGQYRIADLPMAALSNIRD
ncbi:MAG TPA: Rrf2 family transcriptional regulator [Burkholderiales bacterium]|nr:Rrf2 family transcriptional regulator [Burkholderiales bacterium]